MLRAIALEKMNGRLEFRLPKHSQNNGYQITHFGKNQPQVHGVL